MNESALNEQYKEITLLIRRKQLKKAMEKLGDYLSDIPDGWKLQGELQQIATSYGYMLEYMRKGMVDPERHKLHAKLLIDVLSIADRARILKLATGSTHQYFSTRNRAKVLPRQTIREYLMELESQIEEQAVAGLLQETLQEDGKELRQKYETTQKELFEWVWTNSYWSAQDESEAEEFLQSVLLSVNDLCLFVSAVTLSLMECFDLRKQLWLFKAYEHASPAINQRALVGLAISFQMYHERLLIYPEVAGRLSLLSENEQFSKELARVQVQMLQSQETAKIDKKMREEIIPEVIKSMNPDNMKIDFDENDEEGNEYNPEWKFQDIDSSPIGDKLREMSELQMEGADIYMSTFSQLKSYPFFKSISNWFYPFDMQHSAVTNEFKEDKTSILSLVFQSGFFCDSDKYSMCFTMMHIPQAQRNGMISQLNEQQMSELMDEAKQATAKSYFERPEIVSNLYIHNLYRFFKLFPRRHEFRDIFNEPLRLYRYTLLQPLLHKAEYLQAISEYFFRKEHYNEAANLYETLRTLTEESAELYQKMGYCRQKQQRYEEAIEAYLRADMLKPDSVWTNRRLATCYRITRDFDKALAYYKKVEESQPEKHNLLFNIGSCLAELKEYDEALKYFFKLDFLQPNTPKTWRAIVWCSFVSLKYEQAIRYCEKIVAAHPVAADYMNYGHIYWCMGNPQKAMEFYNESVRLCKDKEEFTTMFYKDLMYLTMQGVDEDDIPLMLDLL